MNYGFNDQGLPIYAEANLGGKTRFLPINLVESIGELMIFGDDNDWQIFGLYLQLDNDHHSYVHIIDPDAEASYRCDVVGTKRIKD
ncbi:hypothetical protein CPI23_07255 [Moraxella catarrhalis]|uniref:ACP-like domain-containing protein n=1 Tax=Moraxella catarrhalis TaxID=480 RepID=UPI000E49EDCE|nr:hypothetical protein [Moraxella catarrhalis]AXT97437.1 hypothetical protein SQ02_00545 [Moraxella catarrhalis]AZQ90200.1 hypothetical protein EJK50_2018 [Moraxella catarrhalis]MCG6816582.1 hypothetical protein [Moraxella catarrhalis]MPW99383.1 hypothetical protein [Moraxella catarrhalis]MPX10168.1 hypothetical protein [Moraxella catarrhalis]